MTDLPHILAGPILRHTSATELVVWLVCSADTSLQLQCHQGTTCLATQSFASGHNHHVQLGDHAHLHLLCLQPEQPLPTDHWLHYDIGLDINGETLWLRDTLPSVLYAGELRPRFVIKSRIDQLLHGSCRKPHFAGADGLLMVDRELAAARDQPDDISAQPALLLLTGDQIYVDDVAGPMLVAIHQVAERLGLHGEALQGNVLPEDRREILNHSNDDDAEDHAHRQPRNYYRRAELLPDTQTATTLREVFFTGARKPVFTSANADNHLITLAEMLAQYLLIWSPALWDCIELEPDNNTELPAELLDTYRNQLPPIRDFAAGLAQVQRALANIQVYMIFDDHDVTDDWNLTRAWESSAYQHPFSRRIIGNALIAYLLCQGWGNAPQQFPDELIDNVQLIFREQSREARNHLIDLLLKFEGWQYSVATQPKLVVLDTRTQRWRSESGENFPSGLMDWEALIRLQQELMDEKAVILVSAAPIFGVKLIEIVQQIFTWFGHALTVDAENWMAHPGAASVILNIFHHRKTPQTFVILSGDVHYSFVYDVRLKKAENESPRIWQITSSGIRNGFPPRLLRLFDRLNRWLFASSSPLNWLTRRRYMRIRQRRPGEYSGRYRHQRLVNASGIGRVRLDEHGTPQQIEQLAAHGEIIPFLKGYQSDWMD